MITIRAADGKEFDTYLAGDAGVAKPAIILFSAIFGINDDMIHIAARWAERGYMVVVPDYFFRIHPGALDRSEAGRKAAHARWHNLNAEQAVADMVALKEYLLASPFCNDTILSLGYCAGGELAFLATLQLGVEAIATFHGTYIERHLADAGKVKAHMTLHYGAEDHFTPLNQIERIRSAFADNPRVDIHVHEGAEHGFSLEGRPYYHGIAASRADRQAQEVFRRFQVASEHAGLSYS